MTIYRLILPTLVLAVAGLSGCKKGCTDPTALNYDAKATKACCCEYANPTLTIRFHHQLNGQPFAYNFAKVNDLGRPFDISLTRFFLSNITLHRSSGSFKFTDDACTDNHFLLVSPDQDIYQVWSFDPGTYTGISFTIGIDTIINNTFSPADACVAASSGHLLQNTDMHWSWNSGYIFLKLEGNVDTATVPDGILDVPMIFHLGTNPLVRTAMINYAFTGELSDHVTLDIAVDYAVLLDGIDLRVDHNTQIFDSLAIRLMNNAPGMFSKL